LINYSSNIPKLYLIKISKWFALTVPILMLYYQDNGLTSQESFSLKAIYSIVIIVLEIPSGYFADTMGRKKTLVIGAVMGVVGMLTYALFGGFWAFLMAEVALGISQSFVSGSDSAMMYDSLLADNREGLYTKLEGRNIAIGNGAESLAAILGGLLAEVSFRLPFMAQTGVALLALPAALTLIEPPALRQGHETIRHTFRIVKQSIFARHDLRYFLLFSSVIGACTLTMAWVYHPYLKAVLGVSLYQIGVIAAGLNMVAAIFSASAHSITKRISPKLILWLIGLLIPLSYLLIGWLNSIWVLAVLVVFYLIRGVATPVLKDYVNMNTPSDIRATVLSVRNFVIRLVFVALAPAIGFFTDLYSYQWAFGIVGSLFLILALILLLTRKND
jgi:MFS family permease